MDAQIETQDYGLDFVATAVRVAQTIDGLEAQGEILLFAVNIYAKSGQRELAGDFAQTIDDSYPWGSTALRRATQTASGKLFEALETAATIKESYLEARALPVPDVKHRELRRTTVEREQQILDEIIYQLD